MHNVRYLRVILTEKCNLNCFFCHKEGGNAYKWGKELAANEFCDCIRVLVKNGIKKIKFMGGEPTLYPQICELVYMINGLTPDLDISLISNGIASKEKYDDLIQAGVNRINISLHGYDKKKFMSVTKGTEDQLKLVFENIEYLKKSSILGKINYVLLKGVNEREIFDVLKYVNTHDLVVDVLNYLGDDNVIKESLHYDFAEIEKMILDKCRINSIYVYKNPNSLDSNRLELVNGGTVNLKVNRLSEVSFLKACKKCKKTQWCEEGISAIRLNSRGVIQPCLFRDDLLFDLWSALQVDELDIVEAKVRDYLNEL